MAEQPNTDSTGQYVIPRRTPDGVRIGGRLICAGLLVFAIVAVCAI